MFPTLQTLTFLRKNSSFGMTLFAAGLHSDGIIEEVFEGTRNAVLAWSAGLSPTIENSAARCLDLLALLPAETVQRLSISLPPAHPYRAPLSTGQGLLLHRIRHMGRMPEDSASACSSKPS